MSIGKIYKVVLLLIAFLVYSGSTVFSKLASGYNFLSGNYIFYFLCAIGFMGIYAILWQIVLKYIPLNKAFLGKSVTLIFIMSFSYFLFGENISLNNVIGAACILIGLTTLSWKD